MYFFGRLAWHFYLYIMSPFVSGKLHVIKGQLRTHNHFNVCSHTIGTSKYKGEIDKSRIIAGEFNKPISNQLKE